MTKEIVLKLEERFYWELVKVAAEHRMPVEKHAEMLLTSFAPRSTKKSEFKDETEAGLG